MEVQRKANPPVINVMVQEKLFVVGALTKKLLATVLVAKELAKLDVGNAMEGGSDININFL